jgi:hypothetical protein
VDRSRKDQDAQLKGWERTIRIVYSYLPEMRSMSYLLFFLDLAKNLSRIVHKGLVLFDSASVKAGKYDSKKCFDKARELGLNA